MPNARVLDTATPEERTYLETLGLKHENVAENGVRVTRQAPLSEAEQAQKLLDYREHLEKLDRQTAREAQLSAIRSKGDNDMLTIGEAKVLGLL